MPQIQYIVAITEKLLLYEEKEEKSQASDKNVREMVDERDETEENMKQCRSRLYVSEKYFKTFLSFLITRVQLKYWEMKVI